MLTGFNKRMPVFRGEFFTWCEQIGQSDLPYKQY